jgi:hypothetical protein
MEKSLIGQFDHRALYLAREGQNLPVTLDTAKVQTRFSIRSARPFSGNRFVHTSDTHSWNVPPSRLLWRCHGQNLGTTVGTTQETRWEPMSLSARIYCF